MYATQYSMLYAPHYTHDLEVYLMFDTLRSMFDVWCSIQRKAEKIKKKRKEKKALKKNKKEKKCCKTRKSEEKYI